MSALYDIPVLVNSLAVQTVYRVVKIFPRKRRKGYRVERFTEPGAYVMRDPITGRQQYVIHPAIDEQLKLAAPPAGLPRQLVEF